MDPRPCPFCGGVATRWRLRRRNKIEKNTEEIINKLRLCVEGSVVNADLLLDALELYPINLSDIDPVCVNKLADLLEGLLCE